MSNTAIHFVNEGEANFHDFTIETQVYGSGGLIELGNDIFGMVVGDANQDGEINLLDNTEHWRVQVGSNGYLNSDFDFDANVFPSDRNNFWLKNLYMNSQVPD